jgi:hypothetical protein
LRITSLDPRNDSAHWVTSSRLPIVRFRLAGPSLAEDTATTGEYRFNTWSVSDDKEGCGL